MVVEWFLYVLTALSTGSVLLELESTIYHRVFVVFLKKKISVFLMLKYHQIWCFLHYSQKLFCLQIFSSQEKEVACLPRKFCCLWFCWHLMYQNIFLKSLYLISLDPVLENVVLKRDRTDLWQSDSSVKQVSVLRKRRGLLFNMRPMQLGLFRFL